MKNQGRKVLKALILFACVGGFAQTTYAIPLAFNFSFTDAANGGNLVQGIISGLEDNATTAATSVFVTSNTGGYGIGEYIGNNNVFNVWTLDNGVIESYGFLSYGWLNALPEVVDGSIGMVRNDSQGVGRTFYGLSRVPGPFLWNDYYIPEGPGIAFTPRTDVPEPGTIALCALALVGFGLSRHQRRLQR